MGQEVWFCKGISFHIMGMIGKCPMWQKLHKAEVKSVWKFKSCMGCWYFHRRKWKFKVQWWSVKTCLWQGVSQLHGLFHECGRQTWYHTRAAGQWVINCWAHYLLWKSTWLWLVAKAVFPLTTAAPSRPVTGFTPQNMAIDFMTSLIYLLLSWPKLTSSYLCHITKNYNCSLLRNWHSLTGTMD